MIKIPNKIRLASIWIIGTGILSAEPPAPDYFSPANIYRFADFLFESGDYHRAVGEYQRYLFAFDTLPGNADSIMFKIGLALRREGDYGPALDNFQRVLDDHAASPLAGPVHIQMLRCYFGQERFPALRDHAARFDFSDRSKRPLIAASYLAQKKWSAALNVLGKPEAADSFSTRLAALAQEGMRMPRKSGLWAGLFSAALPGAGKLYCRRPVEGLQSFVTVALTGWQAYDGFHRDGTRSIKGWIFGVLGGIFYLGNVYGSTIAADIANEEQDGRLIEKVKVTVSIYVP